VLTLIFIDDHVRTIAGSEFRRDFCDSKVAKGLGLGKGTNLCYFS
jgi:hypothetical protein